MQRLIITLIFATLSLQAIAEERVAIAFYDVGRLYDTIPSNFYNDKPFTPNGKNHWDTDRYRLKIEHITATIDSMQMPIVALFGVENEAVVRDIVEWSNQDYSYVHRDLDYYDGLDFALLYYGEQLFVDHILNDYHSLYVAGEVGERSVDILLVRRGNKLRTTLSPIEGRSADIVIVGGNINREDIQRLKLDDPLLKSERNGEGDTQNKSGGWYLNSRIALGGEYGSSRGGAYITPWLINNRGDEHLPIYLIAK